jgi:hypothetical protein
MDSVVSIGAGVGVAIALGFVMPKIIGGQKQKVASILPRMRERGGMTLAEVTQELGSSAFAKGYVMQALEQLVTEGKLVKIAPPPGHPRLRIARDTKYVPAPDAAAARASAA